MDKTSLTGILIIRDYKPPSSITIGLTGGIASGKSAVSKMFEDLSCDVIDADIIARQVVEPNSTGLNQLVKAFGKGILGPRQQLDRPGLRKIVFKNPDKLALLNSILHPLIQDRIINEIKQVKNNFCIIVIPLLCESDSYDWLDRVVVVDVKPATQLKRLIARDTITKKLAHKMMQSQCTRKQRLAIADDVINNERSLSQLKIDVEKLNSLYKSLKI
jgi:dephospho-CoA kinase